VAPPERLTTQAPSRHTHAQTHAHTDRPTLTDRTGHGEDCPPISRTTPHPPRPSCPSRQNTIALAAAALSIAPLRAPSRDTRQIPLPAPLPHTPVNEDPCATPAPHAGSAPRVLFFLRSPTTFAMAPVCAARKSSVTNTVKCVAAYVRRDVAGTCGAVGGCRASRGAASRSWCIFDHFRWGVTSFVRTISTL
jgi:hypothetical protein